MMFDGWGSLGRVALTAVLAYGALVVMLRVSGKRTLSKLNAFDLVVTVALGSTLASVIVTRSVPLADGIAALATLVAMQYLVAWASTRSASVSRAVKSEPRVLFHRGAFARGAMRDERIAEGEILAAVRQASATMDEVEAVILESSGDLSVVRAPPGAASGARAPRALADVRFPGARGADGGEARDPAAAPGEGH